LSTRVLDGRLGFTPTSFYVSHLLGSVNLHPQNFPFHLRLYRDPIKETMLSYAGEKDPISGQIWGGVVATGLEGGVVLGSGRQGFYLDAGGSTLTGTNVNRNSRAYGSTGAYWTVYTNPYGTLKMGANLTGMHYAQNQRYFTTGQGGYFSPDSYVLLNTPFAWESRTMNHLSYRINGSLGVQSFYEDSALPGSLVATDTTPTAQSSIGANYNLDANLAYHLDAHWLIGGFVGVNNAHDYQDREAGVSVKYMQRPQIEVEGGSTGLFNEQLIRPLIVP
jgi:cellulose synthase operon protein C